MRVIKQISKIQPLQLDTVELVPKCSIQGTISTVRNILGKTLASKVTLTANTLPLLDGVYEIVVVTAGTEETPGTYKIVNTETLDESAILTSGDTQQTSVVTGVTVVVEAFSGETIGNKAVFEVLGDQVYIIPGTIVGKIKSGVNTGKWRPVRSTDTLDTDFTQFRVVNGFQITDKSKTTLPHGYDTALSSVYTVDVIVYGQISEAACTSINLTPALKAKMPNIAWL